MKRNRCIAAASLLCGTLFFQTALAQNGSPYWSLAGNTNASASSKLGTTNNVPLRLFTANSERLRIAGDGRVGVGTASPVGKLTLFANGSTPSGKWVLSGAPVLTSFAEATGGNADHILAMAPNTATARPNLIVRRARGTLAAPTAVQAGDFISSLQASGYDGTNFQNSANVDFFADGASSAGNVPMRIAFSTGSNLANRAQRLVVTAGGRVGIGIINPEWPFEVVNASQTIAAVIRNDYTGLENRTGLDVRSNNVAGYGIGIDGMGGLIGIRGQGTGGDSPLRSVGVNGVASGSDGDRMGVYGEAFGAGNGGRYGVFGVAGGGAMNAAGYFDGDVYVVGNLYFTSDRKLKTAIKPAENSLTQLMKLKPSVYEYKTAQYKGMHLPTGPQIGLIADEVKEVFPQLVHGAVSPAQMDAKTNTAISEKVAYEGVNYQGLIPVLVASVQEQQKTIETLLKKIEALESQVTKWKGNVTTVTGAGTLGQASPNPSPGSSRIAYSLPQGATRAQLIVTDAGGKTVKALALDNTGYVNLNTASLSAGTYSYSLLVDGQIRETKQLSVVR